MSQRLLSGNFPFVAEPVKIGLPCSSHTCTFQTSHICWVLLLSTLPTVIYSLSIEMQLILNMQFKLHRFHKIFPDYSRVKFYNTFFPTNSSIIPALWFIAHCSFFKCCLKPGWGLNFSSTWAHTLKYFVSPMRSDCCFSCTLHTNPRTLPWAQSTFRKGSTGENWCERGLLCTGSFTLFYFILTKDWHHLLFTMEKTGSRKG